MKSFRNKDTGVILTPQNKWVEEQLEANSEYVEVGAKASKKSTEKTIEEYSKKELAAYLKTLGIDADETMKKNDLLALIPEK